MPSQILDFSSALPWLGAGILAGLFLYWLVRALIGTDRRRNAELRASMTVLDETRRTAATLTEHKVQLEAERGRLDSLVTDLAPRAALVPQFERQLDEMRQADNVHLSALDTTTKQLTALREDSAAEIALLRQDVEAHSGTAKYYEGEFARVFADHDALGKEARLAAARFAKLQTDFDVASREASEVTRLRSELASAKVDITSLRADLDARRDGERAHRDELARLSLDFDGKIKAAAAESASRADEIARLKTQASAVATAGAGGDVMQLKSQIATLETELNSARAVERRVSMELNTSNHDLAQVRRAMEETSILVAERHAEIERLKVQLAAGSTAETDNYRRFKDALDAANRIAAGLPEKA